MVASPYAICDAPTEATKGPSNEEDSLLQHVILLAGSASPANIQGLLVPKAHVYVHHSESRIRSFGAAIKHAVFEDSLQM